MLAELSVQTRVLEGGFKVYYFYDYESVRQLILSKHHLHGRLIFKALASFSFAHFHKYFTPDTKIQLIPLDDRPKHSFSHTAVLVRALSSTMLRPLYHSLHSGSDVLYQGKSLKYRKENKRKYQVLKLPNHPVILVDDIVTTGLSLQEAKQTLEKRGVKVLFALVLADARV